MGKRQIVNLLKRHKIVSFITSDEEKSEQIYIPISREDLAELLCKK